MTSKSRLASTMATIWLMPRTPVAEKPDFWGMRVRRHCGSNRSTIRKWALAKLILGAGSVLPIVNSNSNISYRKLKLEHIGRVARPQGAMLQNPGQALTMLTTEVPILNLRDEVRGGFKVVGPSHLILLTVHTVDKGKPLCDLVK